MSSEYKLIAKKEYRSLSRDDPTIGLLMMVKNENKRIHVSLESVVNPDGDNWVDAMIIYDTGSTDNTVEIITNFAEKHKINLYMIQGEFKDFSTSRNVSLDFADTIDVHYLLLLDTNDELRGGDKLRKYTKEQMKNPNSAYLMCQQWWSGKHDKYFNVRLIKARNGWRYRGRVHEWIKDTTVEGTKSKHPAIRMSDDIFLYQDRIADDDKTSKRFYRDYKLLLEDHKDNPKEPRTLFYLSQTCHCLEKNDEALYYSKLRTELDGFVEEKFHAFMRCGDVSSILGHDWYDVMSWYMKAFEHSGRVEPLIRIANYYRDHRKWHVGYMFIRRACEIPYPTHCILFVNKDDYDYFRWHLMGIYAYYVGDYKNGKIACLKALETGRNKDLDGKNLQFYLDKEKEQGLTGTLETRRQFVNRVSAELKVTNPKMSIKNITRQANNMWKKSKKR